METLLFESWVDLLRILTLGVLAYVLLVIFLRFAGKRTLSKMNAFDLVVTVALGSTLATILLSKDISLAGGAVALAVLIVMQFAVTWTSVRWRGFRWTVRSTPTLLLLRGRMLEEEMNRERVTEDELLAALRSAGVASAWEAEAVVLESDGTFSVVRRSPGSEGVAADERASVLRDVRRVDVLESRDDA